MSDTPPPHTLVEDVEKNLTGQTLSGLKWVYLGTGAGLVLQLFYTSIMNRVLDPVEFGLIASAQVVLRFGKYASELGLGPALIQRERLTDGEVRAAVTSSVLLGAGLSAGMFLLAPALEAFFESPDVVPVFRALSVTLLLNTMTIVPVSLLSRELRFKALAMLELATFAVGYLGVGLGVALAGGRVWSLVAAAVSQLVLLFIGAYALTRHPLRPSFAFGRVKSLYSFGGKVSVITLMEYAVSVTPSAVIGRYGGIAPLGQFNRASLVVDLPLISFSSGLSRVLFPAISRIQGDRPKVKEAYLSAMRTSGALIVPMAAGAAVAAPQLVEALLGPQWDVAASLVPALAASASFAFLAHYGGIVCEALDVLNAKVVLNAVLLAGIVGGLLAVPDGNLIGYALTMAAVQAVGAAVYAVLMGRLLGITARQQLAIYVPAFIAGAVVAGAIWLVTTGLTLLGAPLIVVVVAQILTGAITLLPLGWYGPLRPVRLDVLLRLRNAGLDPSSSAVMRRTFRLLSVGGGA